MSYLNKTEIDNIKTIKKSFKDLSIESKLKSLIECFDMDFTFNNKDTIQKLLLEDYNIIKSIDKKNNFDMNDKFLNIINSYSSNIESYKYLTYSDCHTSGYAYNDHYKNIIDERLEQINKVTDAIKKNLELIKTVASSDEINYMTSFNVTLGEIIIDCYLYYDYQYSFNYYYSESDYSLFECVKIILLDNKLFDWNNCKFLQKKYTIDYKSFFELFIKKSLLYCTPNPNEYDTKKLYSQYKNYKINDKYEELNIFIKYNYSINIDMINNIIKKGSEYISQNDIETETMEYLLSDTKDDIIVGDYIINTKSEYIEDTIFLYDIISGTHNEEDGVYIDIIDLFEMISKRYKLVNKISY